MIPLPYSLATPDQLRQALKETIGRSPVRLYFDTNLCSVDPDFEGPAYVLLAQDRPSIVPIFVYQHVHLSKPLEADSCPC